MMRELQEFLIRDFRIGQIAQHRPGRVGGDRFDSHVMSFTGRVLACFYGIECLVRFVAPGW